MKQLTGSMTALATPFRNGVLDEGAWIAHINQQIADGTSVLIPMGTTGEAATMSSEERLRAIALCVEATRARVPVIAGAGSSATRETIATVRAVRELGVDGALIVTPFYNKPPQAGLLEHYRLIAQAHPGFPIIVYNVPSRTGVDLLPETVLRLVDIPEIVALKEATGSILRALDIYELVGDRIALISGDDFIVAPFIFSGGRGVISVSSNVAPRLMADLCAAALAGDIGKARALQLKLQPLHRLLFCETSPIPVKRALHWIRGFSDEVRAPLVPMTEANSTKLSAELKHLGLLA